MKGLYACIIVVIINLLTTAANLPVVERETNVFNPVLSSKNGGDEIHLMPVTLLLTVMKESLLEQRVLCAEFLCPEHKL